MATTETEVSFNTFKRHNDNLIYEMLPFQSIDSESPLDNSGAARVLKENSVLITRNVNLTALKPYLIENDCITLDEARQLHTEDSRSDNSIKFISIISHRGVGAFNGFIKALKQFTTDERGEGAHKELLETLVTSIQRVSISQSQRGELPLRLVSYERPAESVRQVLSCNILILLDQDSPW